jgi:hypothetical protein
LLRAISIDFFSHSVTAKIESKEFPWNKGKDESYFKRAENVVVEISTGHKDNPEGKWEFLPD